MAQDENSVSIDEATVGPAAATDGAPAFTPRELRIGALGIGLGLVVGIVVSIVGSLLIASVAGGIGSLVKASPMAEASTACEVEANSWIDVGDEGRSISMKSAGEDSDGADIADMACVLGELDTPDSVISRIDSTRALDGRQNATWDEYSASWGYHPDNGLDIVIEVSTK